LEVQAQKIPAALEQRLKITERKPGFDASNLHGRKKGGVPWILISVRTRNSPRTAGRD